MAETDTWMPWHLAEYLADTMHLSTLEHGAYLLILAHGWRNDGMIAVNERILAGVTRLTVDQWRAIRPTIERFFTSTHHPILGLCWFQKRQVEEIRKAKENKARAQEKSRKANAVRWPSSKDSSKEAFSPPRSPQGVHMDSPQEGKGKDLDSSPGGDARGGYVRNALAGIDAGNFLPAPPDPANLGVTAEALKRVSAKEEFWDPLCRIFGLEPKTVADEQRLYQQCGDFRLKGAAVEEIERRAVNYRLHFTTALTPRAILSNWEVCKEPPAPKTKPGERPKKTIRSLV
jgi:uncharacterized protein YdaU (DUF1376 family)